MRYYFFGLMLIVSVYAAAMPVITSQEIRAAHAALAPNYKNLVCYKIENEKCEAFCHNNYPDFLYVAKLKTQNNNERYEQVAWFEGISALDRVISDQMDQNQKLFRCLQDSFTYYKNYYQEQLKKEI